MARAATDPYNAASVEARVREYFADIPSMIPIAKCESGYRQYGPDGLVLYDPSYSMIGVYQISSLHLPHAYAMGVDVMTLEGNLVYARYLYNSNGIDPWMSSFGCWGSLVKQLPSVLGTTTVATAVTPSTATVQGLLSTLLSLGTSDVSVMAVQQMLNKTGFTVAGSGAGSPGNETTMFGSLTRAAVRRFQCAKNITCSGNESSTGYGMVDEKTYAALVAAVTASQGQASAAPAAPATPVPSTAEKAARIAEVQAQIAALKTQMDALNLQLDALKNN